MGTDREAQRETEWGPTERQRHTVGTDSEAQRQSGDRQRGMERDG